MILSQLTESEWDFGITVWCSDPASETTPNTDTKHNQWYNCSDQLRKENNGVHILLLKGYNTISYKKHLPFVSIYFKFCMVFSHLIQSKFLENAKRLNRCWIVKQGGRGDDQHLQYPDLKKCTSWIIKANLPNMVNEKIFTFTYDSK